MICPNCRKTINDQAKYCGYCGHDFKFSNSPPPQSHPTNNYNAWIPLFTFVTLSSACLFFYFIAINFRLETKESPQPLPYEEPTMAPSTSIPIDVLPETITPTTTTQPISNPSVFIYEYYDLINSRRYESAWIFLTVGFLERKSDATGRPFQFSDYSEYWNTVSSLDILEASIENSQPQAAIVLAKIQYNMIDGTSNNYHHRFYLLPNPSENSWLIDRVDAWK